MYYCACVLSVRMNSCASVLLSSGVSFFVCTLVHLCLSVSMYSCASVLSVRMYSCVSVS